MPTYAFLCESCGHTLELFQGFSEPLPTQCPCCEEKGEAFHQDYSQNNPIGIVKGWDHCTTFGQCAEYNEKREGKEKLALRKEEGEAKRRAFSGNTGKGKISKVKKKTPWWRSGEMSGLPKMDKPLDLKKVKDVQKYIATGEKT